MMRCISLWQPWATAVAAGSKRIETRSWATNYRGPLAIHAAKRCNKAELRYFGACNEWRGALWRVGPGPLEHTLAFGAVVAVAELVDCRPTESFTRDEIDVQRLCGMRDAIYTWTERQMGDFTPGRYGWVFSKDVRWLREPIAFTGQQGLFDVPNWLGEFKTKV